jgi:uncharacterized protein (DUF924 family)
MTLEDCIDPLLNYWFGDGEWKAGLWFQGVDSAQVSSTPHAQKMANEDAKSRTDKHIRDKYLHLIELFVNVDKSGLNPSVHCSQWMTTSRGKIALMLLLDQFTRNAFRGTDQMFAYDSVASSIALSLADANFFHELPWNHKLFVFICLTHSESEEVVNKAALGLSALVSELDDDNSTLAKKVRRILKATEDHLAVLRK